MEMWVRQEARPDPSFSRGDVVNSTGKFDSERTSHIQMIAWKYELGKRQGLTPAFFEFI
jgi:hypothetical protein